MNDWNPNHYRFVRQLQRPEAIEAYAGEHRKVDSVIAWLAVIGIVALLVWDRF